MGKRPSTSANRHLWRPGRRAAIAAMAGPAAPLPASQTAESGAVEIGDEAGDVGLEDVRRGRPAGAGREVACGGDQAQLLDLLAVERRRPQHQLEAVVVRRVVRAGDLDPRRPRPAG